MSANEGSTVGGVPPEVIAFLSGKGGRSLIVKGGAGTGKTTFGLELLERVGKPSRCTTCPPASEMRRSTGSSPG